MLEKSLYDSWKSHMELYIENRENGRMILNSLQNGLLVWPTVVKEDGTTRTKKYKELSVAEKLQANCDLKLQTSFFKVFHRICLAVPLFNQGDDPIACLNKAMAFLIAVASSRFPSTNNQLRTFFNLRNQATIQDDKVTVQQVQGRQGQSYDSNSYKGNVTSSGGNNAGGQAMVVKCYNCQEAHHFEPNHTDLDNQSVHAMQSSKETPAVDFTEVSRSKMLAKQNDPMSKEKKVNTTPINYVELNRLSEDFCKRFVPQQEFSDEQAFWLQTSHPNTNQSASSPVKIKVPKELPKTSFPFHSLVNMA
uniref:Retrovirus-related Pol polyprotein from transposon TNT 1-94 n=1 Tax=Tanacetum cinerariifolium TaxID=118510 RepID=A0A6L2JTE0_TANCI|nr:hypothetical protein [Tanacetum cinerariifolium]